MYKVLLCWRYLLTRYLALACIISVMLGVATLIVVNSVMSGFATKLRDRLHSLLSDVVVESFGVDGFWGAQEKMAKIKSVPFLNERIEAMAPTMEVFAMLSYRWPNGERVTRAVRLVGIDPKSRGLLGGFKEHLIHQKENAEASFEIPEEVRKDYEARFQFEQMQQLGQRQRELTLLEPNGPPPTMPPPAEVKIPCGAILGDLIASYRDKNDPDENGKPTKKYVLERGAEVVLTTIKGQYAGQRPEPVYDSFVVADYFQSEMSEYDSQYVFVPLAYLQHIRNTPDRVTSIQIKLKNYDDAKEVVKKLGELFPGQNMRVETWEDKQGPLLAAIAVERSILNVLLFLIIGVAGFGILAIFTMIVAEKTRDIGILKALGASNGGVMKIFLSYGFLLGVVGAWLGTLLGTTLTNNINEVEKWLSSVTGTEVFPRDIYYFNTIPTDMRFWTLVWINVGAVGIAVVFSVLPALRAAMLHPVRALRYE
jgi:lipoprotein-releasing system permease protein